MAEVASRNRQRELPLPLLDGWGTLPTTKVRRPAFDAPFAWAYTYTAFSLQFASAALELLGADQATQVLDPFTGSGTTLFAAALRGCNAVGVDVSPFAALLSRSRLALHTDPERVKFYLNVNASETRPSSALGLEVLGPANSAYVGQVIGRILNTRKVDAGLFWRELLADDVGALDSEAVTLMCLGIAARDCTRLAKGSNPIWFRRIADAPDQSTNSLKRLAMSWAGLVCRDLVGLRPITQSNSRVLNADITNIKLPREFDICLTSPPYLNRLDYVVAHLPELSVLESIVPISVAQLRSSMIGTTKIVSKEITDIPEAWGYSCLKALKSVLEHGSYASQRYYYHTYFLYFKRLYEALDRVVASLRQLKACLFFRIPFIKMLTSQRQSFAQRCYHPFLAFPESFVPRQSEPTWDGLVLARTSTHQARHLRNR
jgi:hypothetical protein